MKKIYLLIFLISCSIVGFAQYQFSFQDPNHDIELRIDDLISRLTLKQKAEMMLYNSPAIDSLGIPAYNWWNECLHGVGRAGRATVFPQAIGLAATFDENLIMRIGDAISTEARAKYNIAIRKDNRKQYLGLSFWTPNINIFRDPRWGRGQETYGEDPYLTGRMGASFVRGLQGENPHHLKAAACAKHYVVHSGPEESRHRFNANPDERDFRETYLPAFKDLVDANVEGVMCAYNRVNDEPCCGSKYLLNEILRVDWGFKGHIVTDCWALDDIFARHEVKENATEAAAMAANAGVNLNCGYVYGFLPEAVNEGLIKEETIDEILRPLLKTRFRLGLFDPLEDGPYAGISPGKVNGPEHKKLAYEAAAKSIVLLKNSNNILPLRKDTLKSMFITGPIATDLLALVGNYNGYSGEMATILEGIFSRVDAGTTVDYNPGFLFSTEQNFQGFWAAKMADVVIVTLGINKMFEGEEGMAMMNPSGGGDRADIGLPANQLEYVKQLKENIGETQMIVVITGGSAIAIPEIIEYADAILFAWYPGEQGGYAVADILFGNINPSGKLPVTFYESMSDLPPFDDYSMKNRTYRYFQGSPLFEFGYGLSYSTFEYLEMEILENVSSHPDEIFNIEMKIKNNGPFSGDEVVQIYATMPGSIVDRPIKWLVGFKRIYLKNGEETKLTVPIQLERLKFWDVEQQNYILESGVYEIQVGSSSSKIHLVEEIYLGRE